MNSHYCPRDETATCSKAGVPGHGNYVDSTVRVHGRLCRHGQQNKPAEKAMEKTCTQTSQKYAGDQPQIVMCHQRSFKNLCVETLAASVMCPSMLV